MSTRRQVVGRWGEDAAAQYLAANGYKVLTCNCRTAHGEIDLVASKDGLLVFVEVKTHRSYNFVYPEDSVTRRKQAYLLSAAEKFLQAHPDCGESWQIDIIAAEGTPGGNAHIEHFENVIS
jgi:putative endonuclease